MKLEKKKKKYSRNESRKGIGEIRGRIICIIIIIISVSVVGFVKIIL